MRPVGVLLCIVLLGCAEPAQETAWFADETATRGPNFTHISGHLEEGLLPEIVGEAFVDRAQGCEDLIPLSIAKL